MLNDHQPRNADVENLALTIDGSFAGFAGANADAIIQCGNKDLSIADMAGAPAFNDGVDRFFHELRN